jgi:hypothetical protein
MYVQIDSYSAIWHGWIDTPASNPPDSTYVTHVRSLDGCVEKYH